MIVNFGLRKSLGSVQYPNFSLPLNDAGSGAVNTTPSRGSGSATFTRAGATATTVLSNGLVSSVIAANTARSYYDPAPVGGTASYMYLPGVSGAYASTPDASPVSVTGDIDVRVQVMLPDWTPTTNQMLISKANSVGNQFAYDFFCDTNGFLNFRTSPDGTTGGSLQTATSSIATGIADGATKWVRAARSSTTGTVTFYTGDDGSSWTQLGSTQSTTVGGIFDSNTVLSVGIQANGTSNPTTGRIFRTQLYNGINGTLVADFNPARTTQGQTSFAATTGETWTINGLGYLYAAPAYLGYIAEEARTNICLQSEDFATTWAATAGSASANATTAPDGNATADKFQETATTAQHFFSQSVAKAASAIQYSFTCWLKAAERGFGYLMLDDGGGANYVLASWNLSTGNLVAGPTTAGTFTGGTAVAAKAYPNGWWRCTITGTTNTAVTVRMLAAPSLNGGDNFNYSGTLNSGIYFWGAQLEVGAFATSYIPTTTGSVTRAADVLTYPSAGNLVTAQGTIFCRAMTFDLSAIRHAFGVSAAGDTDTANLFIQVTTGATRGQVKSGGATQADVVVGSGAANTVQRMAMYWNTNAANAFDDGVPGTVDTSVTVPTSFTTVIVGLRGDAGLPLNGCVRDLRGWQRVLSDSQIASIR